MMIKASLSMTHGFALVVIQDMNLIIKNTIIALNVVRDLTGQRKKGAKMIEALIGFGHALFMIVTTLMVTDLLKRVKELENDRTLKAIEKGIETFLEKERSKDEEY